MKDPVHIFGCGRGFHLPSGLRAMPTERAPCDWVIRPSCRAGMLKPSRSAGGEVRHARLVGNPDQRDRLCRIHRGCDLAQIIRRKMDGPVRTGRQALDQRLRKRLLLFSWNEQGVRFVVPSHR